MISQAVAAGLIAVPEDASMRGSGWGCRVLRAAAAEAASTTAATASAIATMARNSSFTSRAAMAGGYSPPVPQNMPFMET